MRVDEQTTDIHPPGEIQQQFVEDAFQKSPIAPTELPLLDSVDAPCRDHTWTARLASEKFHSHAGHSPLGCLYHSRNSNRSCSFAKSGSTSASRIA